MVSKITRILILGLLVVMVGTTTVGAALKIGILPDADSIPLIVAREEGLFTDTGQDIELVSFQNPIERDSALQAGVIDGAISDVLAAAFALDNDHKVKITSLTNGRYVLLAAPDSEIKDYSDLEGVQIAISSNTIIEYVTDRLLAVKGMAEKVKKVAIPKIPVRLQMLKEGKIEAACLPEPLASVVQLDGAGVIGSSNDLGEAPGIMLFTGKAVSEKTAEIEAFYQAYSSAVKLINRDPDSFRELLVTKGGFPAAIKETFVFPEYDQPVLPRKETVNLVLKWLDEKELIKTELSYDDLVTDQFIK